MRAFLACCLSLCAAACGRTPAEVPRPVEVPPPAAGCTTCDCGLSDPPFAIAVEGEPAAFELKVPSPWVATLPDEPLELVRRSVDLPMREQRAETVTVAAAATPAAPLLVVFRGPRVWEPGVLPAPVKQFLGPGFHLDFDDGQRVIIATGERAPMTIRGTEYCFGAVRSAPNGVVRPYEDVSEWVLYQRSLLSVSR